MKKEAIISAVSVAVILVVTLFGCARENLLPGGETTDEGSYDFYRDYTGTGLPGDHIGYYLLYVNGDLYTLAPNHDDGFRDTLPEGFTLAGRIQTDDFYKIPRTELSACHIREGSEVYTNPDGVSAVYVIRRFDDGRVVYDRYELCSESELTRYNEEEKRVQRLKNK